MIIQNESCILGIKTNGVSFKIDTLSFNDDQSEYDYICDVSSSSFTNGNGSFKISILNKELIPGLPLGKWILIGGEILYNWGSSAAYFYLVDENNDKTNAIEASESRGSSRGFDINSLSRSIFTKAREIIAEYPSARIYNSFSEFIEKVEKPSQFNSSRFTILDKVSAISEYKKNTINRLKKYFDKYDEVFLLLDKSEDVRSKRLLERAINVCYKTIVELHSKE